MALSLHDVQDSKISNNIFDLGLKDRPSGRYGYLGGSCIYISQEGSNSNISIIDNECNDFANTGFRLNGNIITVSNNHINHRDNGSSCNTVNFTPTAKELGGKVKPEGMAIKAHMLTNSNIDNNCIRHSTSGIVLESWDEISNVDILSNFIKDGSKGIQMLSGLSGYSNSTISNILLNTNQIWMTTKQAIYLKAANFAMDDIRIWNSTVSNGNSLSWIYSAIYAYNVKNSLINQNWIYGKTGYNGNGPHRHINLNKTISSNINYNTMIGIGSNPADGGIKVPSGSNYNYLTKNEFTNMSANSLEVKNSNNVLKDNTVDGVEF